LLPPCPPELRKPVQQQHQGSFAVVRSGQSHVEPSTIGGHHPVRPRSRRQDEGGIYGHVREATGGRQRAYPPHGGHSEHRGRRSAEGTAVITFAGAPKNEKAGGPDATPGPPAPSRTGQSPEACMPALMESITELSASVDTSP